jgi:hypothetical protein
MSRDGSAVGIIIENGLKVVPITGKKINKVGIFRLEPEKDCLGHLWSLKEREENAFPYRFS